MASILLVCTGNVCRSPVAEAMVRSTLSRKLGDETPKVSSAGTAGWEGSPATREAVHAAAERGVDISRHVARRLDPAMVGDADLVLCMGRAHCEEIVEEHPADAGKVFTLKEFVRLVEEENVIGDRPAGDSLAQRVALADGRRRGGFTGNPLDEDITDPLGLPLDAFRAVAWELE